MSNLILIVALALARNVFGQSGSSCDKFGNYIETQADIDAVSHCSVLTGGLGIDYTFEGSAVIPGVREVNSFWAGNPGASHSAPTMGETLVSSISLPDLVSAGANSGGFQISGAPYLYELDLPKLKIVGGVLEVSGTNLVGINMPSLETIYGPIYFSGNFNWILLPKLKTARQISITTTGALDCSSLWAQLKGIKWTNEDSEIVPTFQCTSAKGEFNSPLTEEESSPPSHPTTTKSTTSAAQIPSSTTTIHKTSSESSKTSTTSTTTSKKDSYESYQTTTVSMAPGTTSTHETSSITTTYAASPTLAPTGSNSTITLRTSSTTRRLSSATAVPEALDVSAGNILVAGGAWAFIGSVVAVTVGLLLQ